MKQVQAPKQKEKKVVVPTIRWKTFASPKEKSLIVVLFLAISTTCNSRLEMVVMILFFVMVIVMMVRLRVKWLGVI
jgi:hypothetical protein